MYMFSIKHVKLALRIWSLLSLARLRPTSCLGERNKEGCALMHNYCLKHRLPPRLSFTSSPPPSTSSALRPVNDFSRHSPLSSPPPSSDYPASNTLLSQLFAQERAPRANIIQGSLRGSSRRCQPCRVRRSIEQSLSLSSGLLQTRRQRGPATQRIMLGQKQAGTTLRCLPSADHDCENSHQYA